MDFQELRKKYPNFVYEKYSYRVSKKSLEIIFSFSIPPDIKFNPKIIIQNINQSGVKRVGEKTLNNLIFNLGLIEMVSYWKATCSPMIEIQAGHLNKKQIKWWRDLIIKGMGQFFYENKIDFRKQSFLTIKSNPILGISAIAKMPSMNQKKVLVPIGGGKDSAVTLELLKNLPIVGRKNISCLFLNPTKAALKIMKISGCEKSFIVHRKIDKNLLELNRRGFLNGHTPFSAFLAFLSLLAAAIAGQKYIAFSNERSSNEGNVIYLGATINHQWSKSFEFEKKFRQYSKKYLVRNVEYFSFLRPLYEIQIAKLFSKYPKYFSAFLSCNEAYKTASGSKRPAQKWCGECSKCLFVFTILHPFLKERELLKIFKKNLFCDKNLLSIMQQLIGESGFKPFECVGTKKESLIAFYLSWKRYRERFSVKLPFPFLLKYFEKNILVDELRSSSPFANARVPQYPKLVKEAKKMIKTWNNQHNLPKEFEKILKAAVFLNNN